MNNEREREPEQVMAAWTSRALTEWTVREIVVPTAYSATRCWKKRARNLVARSVLWIALLSCLLVPTIAYADPITALELIVAGTTILANLTVASASLVQIFGQDQINSQSDDSPLYSQAGASPILEISATATTFHLLLKQTNDVSEFEDDQPATLKGITSVDTANGKTAAWGWTLILEADIGSITGFNFEFEAHPVVTHLFIPHPDLKEVSPATALDADLELRTDNAMSFSTSAVKSAIHDPGPHRDRLVAGLDGETSLVGLNHIDFFNVRLDAQHDVPVPSTLFLLIAGLPLATLARRWRKRSHCRHA